MQLTVVKDLKDLRAALAGLRKKGRIGFVPTMGALHAGHASLVRLAATRADAVGLSIFVNPTQFGPNEDFKTYPRTLEADVKIAEAAGASLIYAPEAADMYPQGFATSVSAGELGKILDGAFRPGHFDGVATVVAKLLLRVMPDVAVFGEKDYQQLCVIRRMVADLDIPVAIVGAPTLREADGLAMSSRNAYLSQSERALAPKLYETLQSVASQKATIAQAVDKLTVMGFKVDYLERYDARLLVAATLGKTRLIDNIPL